MPPPPERAAGPLVRAGSIPHRTAVDDAPLLLNVGDADFDREVLERSSDVPVLADFWAPWCGPCRVLGPLLEELTTSLDGAVVLARVNIDEATEVARRFGDPQRTHRGGLPGRPGGLAIRRSPVRTGGPALRGGPAPDGG